MKRHWWIIYITCDNQQGKDSDWAFCIFLWIHHLVFTDSKLEHYRRNVCQRDITVRAPPCLVFTGSSKRSSGLFLPKYFGCFICISPTHQRLLTSAYFLWNTSNGFHRLHTKVCLILFSISLRKEVLQFEQRLWHCQKLSFARSSCYPPCSINL